MIRMFIYRELIFVTVQDPHAVHTLNKDSMMLCHISHGATAADA
jgi:hypothetical protein